MSFFGRVCAGRLSLLSISLPGGHSSFSPIAPALCWRLRLICSFVHCIDAPPRPTVGALPSYKCTGESKGRARGEQGGMDKGALPYQEMISP